MTNSMLQWGVGSSMLRKSANALDRIRNPNVGWQGAHQKTVQEHHSASLSRGNSLSGSSTTSSSASRDSIYGGNSSGTATDLSSSLVAYRPASAARDASGGDMRSWKNRLTSILQHTILLPPTMGALSGALIGLTPFLRRHVVLQSGELNFLFNAVDKCGEGVVPVLMMMLGSSLASESLLNLDAGLGFRANLAIAIAKLCVMPAFGLLVFHLLVDRVDYPYPYNDALWLALLLITASPSTTTLIIMAGVATREMKAQTDAAGVPSKAMVTPSQAVAGVLRMQYMVLPILTTMSLTVVLVALCTHGTPKLVPYDNTLSNNDVDSGCS